MTARVGCGLTVGVINVNIWGFKTPPGPRSQSGYDLWARVHSHAKRGTEFGHFAGENGEKPPLLPSPPQEQHYNCKRWQCLSRLSVVRLVRPRGRHYFRINLEGRMCLAQFSGGRPAGPPREEEEVPSRLGRDGHRRGDPHRSSPADRFGSRQQCSVTSEQLAHYKLYLYSVNGKWHLT